MNTRQKRAAGARFLREVAKYFKDIPSAEIDQKIGDVDEAIENNCGMCVGAHFYCFGIERTESTDPERATLDDCKCEHYLNGYEWFENKCEELGFDPDRLNTVIIEEAGVNNPIGMEEWLVHPAKVFARIATRVRTDDYAWSRP